MPAYADIPGDRKIVSATPSGTSQVTLHTADGTTPKVILLKIANLTASAANATVKWGDGTTDYSIIDTYSIPGRGYLIEDVLIPLSQGYTIKITSGTASALTFTIVM